MHATRPTRVRWREVAHFPDLRNTCAGDTPVNRASASSESISAVSQNDEKGPTLDGVRFQLVGGRIKSFLPIRGLVVITGANATGKTSLLRVIDEEAAKPTSERDRERFDYGWDWEDKGWCTFEWSGSGMRDAVADSGATWTPPTQRTPLVLRAPAGPDKLEKRFLEVLKSLADALQVPLAQPTNVNDQDPLLERVSGGSPNERDWDGDIARPSSFWQRQDSLLLLPTGWPQRLWWLTARLFGRLCR
jgi:hypothetical protein